MPWPPTIPPATRSNATSQLDTHPADHNTLAQAATDTVTKVNAIAWGPPVAPAVLSASVGAIGTAFVNVAGLAVTATLTAGRRYLIRAYLLASSGGGNTYVRGRINSSVAGVLAPIVVPQFIQTSGSTAIIVDAFVVGAGAAHTFTAQAMVDTGTMSVGTASYLSVTDVGP